MNSIIKIPSWDLLKANFVTEYLEITKNSNQPHILKNLVLEFLHKNYQNHLQIYTDGSKLDNDESGAAFYIPKLNISKIFHTGENFSIFSAELIGILQALKYIDEHNIDNKNVLLCVDSKAAISSINNSNNKYRVQMIQEIQYLIHQIIYKNYSLTFIWMPSHCNILGNEKVDKLAKKGAQNHANSIFISYKHDFHEYSYLINNSIKNEVKSYHNHSTSAYSQICVINPDSINPTDIWKHRSNHKSYSSNSIISRLRLNALKTKYVHSIKCNCGSPLTVEHLLLNCPKLKLNIIFNYSSLQTVLNSPPILTNISKYLLNNPISNLL